MRINGSLSKVSGGGGDRRDKRRSDVARQPKPRLEMTNAIALLDAMTEGFRAAAQRADAPGGRRFDEVLHVFVLVRW